MTIRLANSKTSRSYF